MPAGAIGGIDAIAAMRVAGLTSVRYRSRKPPAAWRGSPAEKVVDLGTLTQRTVLYKGTAGEAALLYPQNANVAAAVALAGFGFDATEVELVADPDAPGNIHEIEAEGDAGRFAIQLQGKPSRSNPKTSALAAMSVARALPPTISLAILLGSPVERIEDFRFLRGRGQFVDDLARDDLLHAVICAARWRTGASASIDTRAAPPRPGVHAVITAADIGAGDPDHSAAAGILAGFKPFEQPVIAHSKVRYVGEPIAVVLAESAARRRGCARGHRRSTSSRCRRSRTAPAAGATTLCCSRPPGSNLALTLTGVRGDADAAFKGAPYVGASGSGPAPRRGADGAARAAGRMGRGARPAHRAWRRQGRLPQPARAGEADGAPRKRHPHGGERRRRRLRRPRRVLSGGFPDPVRSAPHRPAGEMDRGPPRASHATNHARDAECELEIACDRDGTILALRGRATTDHGAYIRTNGATAARNIAQVLTGPYRIPHMRIDVSLMMTNKTPVGTYRGPGRFEADFFRERLFDIAAARSRHRSRRVPPPQPDR